MRVGQHSRSTMSCSPRWAAQCAAEEAAGAQEGAGMGTHQERLAPPLLCRASRPKKRLCCCFPPYLDLFYVLPEPFRTRGPYFLETHPLFVGSSWKLFVLVFLSTPLVVRYVSVTPTLTDTNLFLEIRVVVLFCVVRVFGCFSRVRYLSVTHLFLELSRKSGVQA